MFQSSNPAHEALRGPIEAAQQAVAALGTEKAAKVARQATLAQEIPAAMATGEAEQLAAMKAERDEIEGWLRDYAAAERFAAANLEKAERRWADAVIAEAKQRAEALQLEAHPLTDQLRRHCLEIVAALRDYREARSRCSRAQDWPEGVTPWGLGPLTGQLYAFLIEYGSQPEPMPTPAGRGKAA